MKTLRKLLRRTPLFGAYKSLVLYPDYWSWKLRGEPQRSPHLLKQRTVRACAKRYGLSTLMETGTYYGEMVCAMKRHFDLIYSVEFDPRLAQRAMRKFARYPHIHIVEGDSQRVLPELLRSLTQPALFWLDAGYYGWEGVHVDRQRLSRELEAILHHRVPGHVILMDDAHTLDGRNGALTVEGLKSRVASEFPGRAVEVKHDIVRITPQL